MLNLIEFEFQKPHPLPDGLVKISLNHLFPKSSLPIRMMVYDVSNRVVWSSELYNNMFSLYYEIPYKRIEVSTPDGTNLLTWNWNAFEHGDICHQLFYLWSLKNRGCKGIAIGAHDGTSGEWVGPVKEGILNAVLIEPSEKQLSILRSIYENIPWIKIEQTLVTEDGRDCAFYEGATGHTNSVNKDHLLKFTNEVKEITLKSTTVNDLVKKHQFNEKWWLHIDAEDLDDKILISIDDNYLPSCIIFEHEQLSEQRLSVVQKWLDERNYTTNKSVRNTICIKD